VDEELRKLVMLCKEKDIDLAKKKALIVLLLPPSSLKGDMARFKEVDDYKRKREEAKETVKKMGGFDNLLKDYDTIKSQLSEIKSKLAEYIEEYSSEELETMVTEDEYEWLVDNEGEIKKHLKGIDA